MNDILSLGHEEARKFLLAGESYCTIPLPTYFNFDKLMQPLSEYLKDKNYKDVLGSYKDQSNKDKNYNPKKIENINYHLFQNKDGKYEWRKFELIHPVLYIFIVQEITKAENWKIIKNKFNDPIDKSVVECVSLPLILEYNKNNQKNDDEKNSGDNKRNYIAEQIANWTKQVEHRSIALSLDYSYTYHTDITDCYGSIYTHSIPWFLHTKETAKNDYGHTLFGNIIDSHLRDMSYGQTNGIPQGSVLMNFISEMVLCYADKELSKKINDRYKDRYKIIRYRDDYRIFVNEPTVGNFIIKNLSEVLIDLGFKLRADKTILSNDTIKSSIKKDKMDWISSNRKTADIQKQLLVLYNFSLTNTNSGTLEKELLSIFKNLQKKIRNTKQKEIFLKTDDIHSIIGIVVNIAYQNPRTCPAAFAILSIALLLLKEKETENMKRIIKISENIACQNIKVFNAASKIADMALYLLEEQEIENKMSINIVVKKIQEKFKNIPNVGYMDIWLQRMTLKLDFVVPELTEKMCELVSGGKVNIWNNEWLKKDVVDIFNKNSIIDRDIIKEMPTEIGSREITVFGY